MVTIDSFYETHPVGVRQKCVVIFRPYGADANDLHDVLKYHVPTGLFEIRILDESSHKLSLTLIPTTITVL
ncbi:MAG: hypothetical protein A3D31_10200 [Candidatus Fluviicola riflensis]|nr:MAG: hypothetical protein A3D31_10200 [Candidatus Fluviicola riflensis]OGS84441.1 MAG: hypothetical protein A2724_07140 [Fluviicola sp. RIFCSPHIGHO2_01_FULL_43_53]